MAWHAHGFEPRAAAYTRYLPDQRTMEIRHPSGDQHIPSSEEYRQTRPAARQRMLFFSAVALPLASVFSRSKPAGKWGRVGAGVCVWRVAVGVRKV